MTIRQHGVRPRDVILTRPFEHVLAVVFILIAVDGLLSPGGPFGGLLAEELAMAWHSLGIPAGVAILLGMHHRGDAQVGRAIEGFGWLAVIVLTWGGVALVVWLAPGFAEQAGLTDDLLIGAGAAIRGAFLWGEGRAARKLYSRMVLRGEAVE